MAAGVARVALDRYALRGDPHAVEVRLRRRVVAARWARRRSPVRVARRPGPRYARSAIRPDRSLGGRRQLGRRGQVRTDVHVVALDDRSVAAEANPPTGG